ncbi:PAS domain S-box protein [Fulvivirga sp. M361]|uniref:ATP-binding protein n=1 Tax=Fulvivirga sp. M361 TaxID=2594266 RepID=UPI001179E20E|nr:ATP-binding protein [Fulvivirga sp. M361]TRX53686.1 PAS domain S-box protein [Fulvivirga sp. M361]
MSIERFFLIESISHTITAPERQRVTMAGLFTLLGVIVCIGYILWELHSGNFIYIPFYLIILFSALVSLFLMRTGRIVLGKFVFVIPVVTVLFVMLTVEKYATGLHVFFIVFCVYALAVFGYKKRYYAFSICGYVILLLVVHHIFDPQFIAPISFSEEYIKSTFIVNNIVGLICSMLIVFYLMKINYDFNNRLKLATKELHESRSRFDLAIKGSDAGIWDWNSNNGQIQVSALLAELLEYDPEDLSHLTIDMLWDNLHPDDFPKFKRRMRNHLKNREPFRLECRLRSRWGEYIWVLGTGQAEWDESGKAHRMVGTILNINERKHAEKRIQEQNDLLEKTNAELDRFVYSTSHDLKAPLSSILGLIHIAELAHDDQEIRDCFVMMKQRVHTLNSFIEDIIDYSRNSRLTTKPKKIELNELIDDITANLEYFDQRNSIRIVKHFARDFHMVIDEGRLKIVLNNLINNAIKYHDLKKSDPYICIKATKNDLMTEIRVEDNGMGITADLIGRVFDMFFRATEKSEGSGLGLYIAREMVKKIGGDLEVVSSLGEGATFILKLPTEEVSKSKHDIA